MDEKQMTKVFVAMAICLSLGLSGGCSSTGGTGGTGMDKAEIGGLSGAGIGALLGQVVLLKDCNGTYNNLMIIRKC